MKHLGAVLPRKLLGGSNSSVTLQTGILIYVPKNRVTFHHTEDHASSCVYIPTNLTCQVVSTNVAYIDGLWGDITIS